MSDSEEENDSNVPPREECQRRCVEFASITQTDTALAMFFLQDREWDLELSIQDYFQNLENETTSGNRNFSIFQLGELKNERPISPINGDCSSHKDFVDPEPHRIRLMSWNIDGLDQNNVATRARGVCRTILSEKPDVVFLQEVVIKNLSVLKDQLEGYMIVLGCEESLMKENGGYFTAVLLRKDTSKYVSHLVSPFYSSIMCRTLLQVDAEVKGLQFCLLTSHLESTKSQEGERLKQLKEGLEKAYEVDQGKVVVYGGDLNLKDSEMTKIGGLKHGFVDIWVDTGERPEAKYTWDTHKNDNLVINSRYKPRCRFDRLFYKKDHIVKAVYFELVGFHRVDECKRYPSDHWGIMAHFDKIANSKN